eukprot:TRINITY_DN31957_c0_g2_i1.p1 TRINITY_DN31957_c0_g2~~TRINITY_DN31957_c0_g2_i1.p1  ORF type:complete len:380 (+),score=112.69 TRINITY_DN31957_c0_g2_i1:681-1820(+)
MAHEAEHHPAVKALISEHKHSHPHESVLVLGGGNFGTCLADHLAYLDHKVTLYCRDAASAEAVNTTHHNPKYLSNIKLTESLKATSDLSQENVSTKTCLLFAIPTQHLRGVLNKVKTWIAADALLLFVNKGLEDSTLLLPCDIIIEELGEQIGKSAVFLSGPSFAQEIVRREVTCVSVASHDRAAALRVQRMFHAPFFRVYISVDPIGVEAAGALKNVIAIAAGVCSGLGMQNNARAALITRGLIELTSMGVALGADPVTFLGLAGVGDLLLTATSTKSRNFTVGYRLGKGEKLKEILESLGSVAEGVYTTKAAYELAHKKGITCPIIETSYQLLYEDVPLEEALKSLLLRDATTEFSRLRTSFSEAPQHVVSPTQEEN